MSQLIRTALTMLYIYIYIHIYQRPWSLKVLCSILAVDLCFTYVLPGICCSHSPSFMRHSSQCSYLHLYSPHIFKLLFQPLIFFELLVFLLPDVTVAWDAMSITTAFFCCLLTNRMSGWFAVTSLDLSPSRS